MVFGIAARRTRDGNSDADDLTQEIWLTVWRNWEKLQGLPYPLGGILKRIAHQVATWDWRRRIRSKRVGAVVPLEDFHHPSEGARQDDSVMLAEVLLAIEQLPEKQRAAIIGSALGDDLKAIAEPEGVSRQAIQQRLVAARTSLHKKGH